MDPHQLPPQNLAKGGHPPSPTPILLLPINSIPTRSLATHSPVPLPTEGYSWGPWQSSSPRGSSLWAPKHSQNLLQARPALSPALSLFPSSWAPAPVLWALTQPARPAGPGVCSTGWAGGSSLFAHGDKGQEAEEREDDTCHWGWPDSCVSTSPTHQQCSLFPCSAHVPILELSQPLWV